MAQMRVGKFFFSEFGRVYLVGADCRGVNCTDSNLVGVVFETQHVLTMGNPLAMGMVMRVADVERMAGLFLHRRFAFKARLVRRACSKRAVFTECLEHSVWDSVCIDAVDFTQATLSWS